MKKNNNENRNPASAEWKEYRRLAEKILARNTETKGAPGPKESAALIHELEVHQVELELQNRELQQAQLDAELARHKYFTLYDLAPVGYATFAPGGAIQEINLTGAALLREERKDLIKRPFQTFLGVDDNSVFNHFLKNIFSEEAPQRCEVTLKPKRGYPARLRLEGGLSEPVVGEGLKCQVALLDLTEQKQAEQALRESRERFETLVDTIPDISFEADGAGNITFVSRQWTVFTGMTFEETFNRGWMKALHPEETEAVIARRREALQNGEFAEERYRLRAADGSYRWFLVKALPTRNETGKVIRWTGSLTDVDDLIRTQEALRLRESELNLVMDAVPALIAWVDLEGRYRQVNKNYADWFGRSPAEIRGLHMRDLLGEVQWEAIQGYVERALAGESVHYERQLPYRGGESRWIEATYTPDFDERHRVRGFVVHVMDIEERKKIDKELNDSRDDLNRAQTVAHIGNWRMDIRRNELFWSAETHRIFGIPPGIPMTYETFLSAIHPEDRATVDRQWQEALNGSPYDIEHRIVVAGREKWVRERAELEFDPEGALSGAFGTVQDITELKAAEEAIKAARDELELRVQERTVELEEANRHLAEQSRILESFFKDTITPLVLLDRDFNFIRVNEAYARACQRAVTDFPGHNHFEFFPHEENAAIFRRVVETGIPYQTFAKPFEYPDHPEWGVTYWDWILTPLPDDRGKTAFLVFSLEEVTDRQVAEEALRNSERQLRSLADHLLYAQENERKRIARDMHDSLGASLSALKYKMEDLVHNLSARDSGKIEETLGSLIRIIQDTIGEARRMQNALRPPLLDDLGILPTLSWFSREFQKRYPGIAVEQRLDVREEEVPELLKLMIFRITQEALDNIGRHARTAQARIYLGKEKDLLRLTIRDNGAGFDQKEIMNQAGELKGMGLSRIKERAELSGGAFSLKSSPGQGTVIEISWPLNRRGEVSNNGQH